MVKKQIIKKTEEFVRKSMKGDVGHDWLHVDRVRKLALKIGKREKVDLFVVELAALLHDIGDWKFHKDANTAGKKSSKLLNALRVDSEVVNEVAFIIDNISWKNGMNKVRMRTLEGKVVQDADRLEALGAIGIARAFSYGGHKSRPLAGTPDSTIAHFSDKLLKLKKAMNTKSGKSLAKPLDVFVRAYLKQFSKEWAGEN